MSRQIRIAVLMAAHNRKSRTLSSLASLYAQTINEGIHLRVTLVDDGSTDGTTVAVRDCFPEVTTIAGDGSLYWVGAMRLAFAEAIRMDFDFHWWLNDDVVLYPNALETLLNTASELDRCGYRDAIVTGSTSDSTTQEQAHGGIRYKYHPVFMCFDLVPPAPVVERCDTFTGNCVLIPRAVYTALGNLGERYRHFLGDVDYGLRAAEVGFTTWVAPGYVGVCPSRYTGYVHAYDLDSVRAIFGRLRHPKGLQFGDHFQQRLLPCNEWTAFLRRHQPVFWPVPWLLTYRKLVCIFVGRAVHRRRR